MLDPGPLSEYITAAFRSIVSPALKQCFLNSFPAKSDAGNRMAENFCNNFDMLVSDAIGTALAQAIDYYVKNAEIYGTLITTGSAVSQTLSLTPSSTPIVNGAIPNSLGIR